jgi:hypothetical protein
MQAMGIAEFIIGPAEGRTRWLHPSYGLTQILRLCVAGKFNPETAGAAGLMVSSSCE